MSLDRDSGGFRSDPPQTEFVVVGGAERPSLEMEPFCCARTTAMLTFLPAPLALRAPILINVKFWNDGEIEAHLHDALLFGSGEDEAEALDDLRDNVVFAWQQLNDIPETSMAAPAWRMWQALKACVEVTSK